VSDLCSIMVVGRLTADAQSVVCKTGTTMVTFSMANNTGFGQYAKTNYFKCKYFGRAAEGVKQYLTKGKQVCVNGNFEIENWTDQNGQTRLSPSITVRELQLLGGNSRDQQSEPVGPKTPNLEWEGDITY